MYRKELIYFNGESHAFEMSFDYKDQWIIETEIAQECAYFKLLSLLVSLCS